ncbi:MAG: SAM-dependent DNA methyltransferase, partial [Promethearchaeota archaeon]
MQKESKSKKAKKRRRTYGIHLTSKEIFHQYISPHIQEVLNQYIWTDFFAGEGNLILPILDLIPPDERIVFFQNQIYLFDVQPEMVKKCIENAKLYGIPEDIAQKNILLRDTLSDFPLFLKEKDLPIYHITNPPYLYLGYIRKHKETEKYLPLFEGKNEGYQDLYQVAMMEDLRNNIEDLIYIIPTNFLFGASVSNKFRLDFLKHYKISRMLIFETKIFEFTGTNICIGFFQRKREPALEPVNFEGLKIKQNDQKITKNYTLKPKFNYRAGSEFEEFLENYKCLNPIEVTYYLLKDHVSGNQGNCEVKVMDANNYQNNEYKTLRLNVNKKLKEKIEHNILYVRTVDTGSLEGRVGLGVISEDFNVQGIYVSGNPYRTHPIQLFLEPQLSREDQVLVRDYFNFILE